MSILIKKYRIVKHKETKKFFIQKVVNNKYTGFLVGQDRKPLAFDRHDQAKKVLKKYK